MKDKKKIKLKLKSFVKILCYEGRDKMTVIKNQETSG